MTTNPAKTIGNELIYPKNRLLAASGIVALLCFLLLVYPSRQVEAKKTFLDVTTETIEEVAVQDLLEDDDVLASDESALAEAEQPDSGNTRTVVEIKNGDTLSNVFKDVGLSNALLVNILEQEKQAKQFTNLKVGQQLVFTLSPEGQLLELSSEPDMLQSIRLELNPASNTYSFSKHTKETSVEEKHVTGSIKTSLLAATKEAGMPYKLTIDFANIFGYDIDFAKDLRKGDTFEVIYEQNKVNDKIVSNGNILAARLTNRGKTYTAIRYTNKQGYTSYYNDKGVSNLKAFIRTPVDFTRISSKFTNGRKHPILNKIRAHKGVDYAAPTGTPVKATGNGKVIIAGARGGYGNTVIIQHGTKYRTVYAHLRNFAKGIRSGTQVKQGQIIAYVGTTGLSTGPHLHYEFQVNGVHVDPLSHTLPAADPISAAELAIFKKKAAPYLALLNKSENKLVLAPKE